MVLRSSVLFLLLFIVGLSATGQTIIGEVRDIEDRQQLSNVTIENIYTSERIVTDESGKFSITAKSGQLLEFRKNGYKLVRVRIPNGFVPSYFMILVTKGPADLKDMKVVKNNRYDYRSDSIRFHDLYAHELDFPKLSTFDMLAHPFSALSRQNQEIWQFQDDYAAFEKEKYVDKTFNEAIVSKFTGLTGDSLHYYIRRFRPTYEQLRGMNDYTFFNFIKTTVRQYRSTNTPRGAQ